MLLAAAPLCQTHRTLALMQQHAASSHAAPAAAASSSSSSSAGLLNPQEERAMESLVLAYLKKRGFNQTEEVLKQEAAKQQAATAAAAAAAAATAATAGTDAATAPSAASSSSSSAAPAAAASAALSTLPDIHTFIADISLDQHTHLLRQILHYSSAESTPDRYAHSFDHLKRWVAECMEPFRSELSQILWPLYVGCFMQLVQKGFPHDAQRFLARFRAEHEHLHKSELYSLQNLTTDSELKVSELGRHFLSRKVDVTMSSFGHQLLITYLTEQKFILLLKLLNDSVHVRITSRKPLTLESELLPASHTVSAAVAATAAVAGLNPAAVANLNNTPIRWGMLPEYADLHGEASENLKARMRDAQLKIKRAKIQEREEKAKSEAEAEEANKSATGGAEADKPKDAAEEEENAKKKAKVDGGESAEAAASASGTQDTDMGETEEGDAAAASTDKDKSKPSKKSKKLASDAQAKRAVDADSLEETKEEREAIERTVKAQIKIPEAMKLPVKEEQVVKMPPIPADARTRYLADLHFRAKLSSTALPSVCMYTFLNSLHSVNSIRISPDGAIVAAGLSDSTVRVYDLKDPSVRQSTNPAANLSSSDGKEDEVSAMLEQSIYADGSDSIGSFSTITSSLLPARRSEDASRLPYTKLVGHSGPVYATSLSPEGQYLLSASEDATVRLWHLESKRNLVVYKGHNYPVWDVAFAPLGFYFATASHDHTARLWSTNHISPLRLFVGHSGDVDRVVFHPNCNYVATASADSTCRLWDVQSGECVRLFVGHSGGGVRSLAMDPEGRFMASGGEDGRVLVWDLASGRQVASYHSAHTAPVTALEYSADGELLASGGMDCAINLYETKKSATALAAAVTSTPLKTYRTKRTPVQFLEFTPRNLLLAAGVFNA